MNPDKRRNSFSVTPSPRAIYSNLTYTNEEILSLPLFDQLFSYDWYEELILRINIDKN